MSKEMNNSQHEEFIQLKEKFKEIGIESFPGKEVKLKVPKNLKGIKSIDWFEGAKNFWNLRNRKFKVYMSVFKKIYKECSEEICQ